MSHSNKNVGQWTTNDFMSFISSIGIKGTNYDKIRKTMDDDGLSVSDIRGTAADLKESFGISMILAKKIKKQLDGLRITQKVNNSIHTSSTPSSANHSLNSGAPFVVNLRGKQGRMVTLNALFTKDSTVEDVALKYKDQECVKQSYKVEKIVLESKRKVLLHDKTLGYYGITNEYNLITVIFKTKGGSDDWSSRTVDEWDTDDLKRWITTLNCDMTEEQQLLLSIANNSFAGSDLKDETAEDIAEALEITEELAQRLYDGFRNWKVSDNVQSTSYNTSNGSTDACNGYHSYSNGNPSNKASSNALLPYFIGYKLDCKDSGGKWCPAEVIRMDSNCITVKYVYWPSRRSISGYFEDTFNRDEIESNCKEYGVITNTSNRTRRDVYFKTRKYHPTKKEAKQVREEQKAKLKNGNDNESVGLWNSIASAASSAFGYSSNNISGIIGLSNLGNQCYMNSAIQLIVQTPPLLRLFRGNHNVNTRSLFYQFMDLCTKAQYESCYTPIAIKNILAQHDYRSFGNYSQQDSGHALSTLLEILDNELLQDKVYESHSINAKFDGGLDIESEQLLIEKIINEYNPNHKSVIRESMTFIFRETYRCMTPNCDYFETRYNYGQKLVLPLENHSLMVPVSIYSNKGSKACNTSFVCLSYCGIATLTAQIHAFLRNRNKTKDKRYDIDLFTMEYNDRDEMMDPQDILRHISLNNKCCHLIGKCVFAIAKRLDDTMDEDDMKESMLMKQFYVSLDNKGKVDGFDFNTVTTNVGLSIDELVTTKSPFWIYYRGRVYFKDDTAKIQKAFDSMVIVYTKSRNNGNIAFVEDGYESIHNVWKYIEQSDTSFRYKNMINYCKVAQRLRSIQKTTNTSNLKNAEVNYSRVDGSIDLSIKNYNKMGINQRLMSQYLLDALKLSMAKCSRMHSKPLSTVTDCLRTYFESQVLDGGAAVSCSKCNECKIFKKSTTIVRYPQIGTIKFDRFDEGRKYDQKVDYKKTIRFCDDEKDEYDLYGVCNHRSSSTDFGHYYSYVKSVDKNNALWYEANDRNISAIKNERRVIDNRNALILMYQKKNSNQ